jgi:GTP-binding protein HflX
MNTEHVVTVGLKLKNTSARQFTTSMDELRRLVETAGGEVVKQYSQARPSVDPATLIGRGKIAEIAAELPQLNVKTIVFDENLTPAQQKNIEKLTKAKVIDRTRLILDIFAQRAHTREGQLQVELAQMNYMVPRITGSWRGYSQQVGGIGTRGPGERKIEVERRYARERIKRLEVEIEELKLHRNKTRENRESVPLPQIALIGYTNVGKSTLLNTLVKERAVYADDKLFATLDPTTRRVKLPSGRTVLFTDTVGFIQKLPTSLVAAFRSTLEEAARSTLLVHLVDLSAPDRKEQEKTVLTTIRELKASHIPMITAYNKADVSPRQTGKLYISGKTGQGIPELLSAIETKLDELLIEVAFELPYDQRRLLSMIYNTGYVLSENVNGKGTSMRVRMDPGNWKRLSHLLKTKRTSS